MWCAFDAQAQDDGTASGSLDESEIGLSRVYVDDTTFTYTLPADLVTEPVRVTGALTWRYDGQAVLTDVADPPSDVGYWWEEPYSVLTGLEYDAEAYLGVGETAVIDRYGRRWLLDAVDVPAAEAAVSARRAEVEALFGSEGPPVVREGIETNPDGGTLHYSIPTSWDTIVCGGTTRYSDHSNDSLTVMAATPMTAIQRKVVMLTQPEGCTGTLVANNWVLTAGHCLTTGGGVWYNPEDVTVCSMENLAENTTGGFEAACIAGESLTVNGAWQGENNGSPPSADWAMLKLDGAFNVGWMALSTASDGTISSHDDLIRGYPGVERDCDPNVITSGRVDTTQPGRQMYGATGEIQATPSGWIKWDTSSAIGMSGGPHYYCPNGSCDSGHWITGVHASVTECNNPPCSTGYAAGPKASYIEPFVDLIITFY